MAPIPPSRSEAEIKALIRKGEWYAIYRATDDQKPLFSGTDEECRRHARQFNFLLMGPHSKYVLAQVKHWDVTIE